MPPGEPAGSEWAFENAFEPQPLHLHLLVAGKDAEARDLVIEVDRLSTAKVSGPVRQGQSLVWDGSDRMILYDDKGRKVGDVATDLALPLLGTGKHLLTIEARFTGGAEPVLKGTVKLLGTAETIFR